MSALKFNINVHTVCLTHWRSDSRGMPARNCCHGCPITHACHSGPTGKLTQSAIDAWRTRLNDAANKVQA